MKGNHYTVESPAVREILLGVYKNATRNYFKIAPDGRCEVFAVRTQLMALGMGSTSASKILEQANIPLGNFVLNPVVKLEGVTVIRADVEVYGAVVESLTERAGIAAYPPDYVADEERDDDMDLGELDDELEPEVPPAEQEASIPSKTGKKLTVQERDEKAARQEEAANNKRYQYIETSSGKFGIWDDINGYTVFLAYTKEEAIEEMARLKTGKSCTVTYVGGSGTTRPGITY
jgi:hypothetical protein